MSHLVINHKRFGSAYVCCDNRDSIAVLEEFGARIKRNDQGEVVQVHLGYAKTTKLERVQELLKSLGYDSTKMAEKWGAPRLVAWGLSGRTSRNMLSEGTQDVRDNGVANLAGAPELSLSFCQTGEPNLTTEPKPVPWAVST